MTESKNTPWRGAMDTHTTAGHVEMIKSATTAHHASTLNPAPAAAQPAAQPVAQAPAAPSTTSK